MSVQDTKVEVSKLRRRCQLEELGFFANFADIPLLDDFIGQTRAVRAMQFGLNMKAPGYNIFVAGPPGTGKTTYTQSVVTQKAANRVEVPGDWCLLHNFTNPDVPLAVKLPAGEGQKLQRHMSGLVKEIKSTICKLTEDKDHSQRKNTVFQEIQQELDNAFKELREDAQKSHFIMKTSEEGIFFIPVKEGQPLSTEQYQSLPPEEKELLEKKLKELQKRTGEIGHEGKLLEEQAEKVIINLDRQVMLEKVLPMIQQIKECYVSYPKIINYLGCLVEDLTQSISFLIKGQGATQEDPSEDLLRKYCVNLLINNGQTAGIPVVVETNPHYYNLFGKVEYRSHMGSVSTHFTMIKPGALHRANGGYLILQVKDLLADPHSWDALKKALKNRQITVENIGEHYKSVPTISLRPEPIPLDLKVILVGSQQIYHLLQQADEDFAKMFKVMVDFEVEMPRTEENLKNYVAFVGSVCRREGLPYFNKAGLTEIIEYGSRLADNQNKLSTQFNEVVEIIVESAAWAQTAGAECISGEYVRQAINEKVFRSRRVEERIQELILRGKILVATEGAVVGQVNGLAVLDLGTYSFGKPSKITAKTFMGQEGLVNIETETEMSGSIHSKGVLTLTGYLGSVFAQNKPLCFNARVTFEQLYEGVEGDSASSAELYALLSSLSGIPINQSLAVTGSINQNGEIQPIGGVTEKIEGFFSVCKARGLNGSQGVIIPTQNIDNLMLNLEVVEAVEKGLFHIYAISRVEEGIELLTGIPAGTGNNEGGFPEGTVYYLVDQKLTTYAEGLNEFYK